MRSENRPPKISAPLFCYVIVLCLCVISVFHTLAQQRQPSIHSNLRRDEQIEAIAQKLHQTLDITIALVEEATNLTRQSYLQISTNVPSPTHALQPLVQHGVVPSTSLVSPKIEIIPASYVQSGISEYYRYARRAGNCSITNISFKFDEACIKDISPNFIRQVLIVAVQRSGTHFIWEMLNRLDCDVHHEGVGPDGAVSWLYAYKAHRYTINNPEPLSKHRFRHVFHQVRHPLRVISTLLTVQGTWNRYERMPSTASQTVCHVLNRYWEWISSVEKSVHVRLSPLKRTMQLWVAWNKHIEQYADLRFRTEDTSPRDVCRWAQFPESKCGNLHPTQPVIELALPKYAQNISQSEHKQSTSNAVTWAMLDAEDRALSNTIKAMCLEYGYSLSPSDLPQAVDTKEFKA